MTPDPFDRPGKACDYLLGHWEPLTAHLRHGETRLDNNLVENAIRPSAIGKKNWANKGQVQNGGPIRGPIRDRFKTETGVR